MRGNLQDWDNGILVGDHDEQEIQYDSKYYPKAICDLFQILREGAIDDLYNDGCMTKEDCRLITPRLNRLGLYPPKNQEIHHERLNAEAVHASDKTTSTSTSARARVLVDSLQLRKSEIAQLKSIEEINKIERVPRSLSKWTGPLGYGPKSASAVDDFFKRMQKMGMLIVTKTKEGSLPVLTEKAKAIIGSTC